MVFADPIFLFFFLPLCLLAYGCVRPIAGKNAVLLIFSLAFYAWGEPKYILLLVLMTLADWLFALRIERQRGRRGAKWLLAAACTVNLGMLCTFKYGTFALANLKFLTGFPDTVPSILVPIGISFYTFQLISYVVDVYRGDVAAQPRFFRLLLYVSLFHQSIAGPIVRYHEVSELIASRRVTTEQLNQGITRFTVGLTKKALLANACGAVADTVLAESIRPDTAAAQPAALLWLGMLAYMLFIYLDFSAYSDMAIGMGLMVGFRYPENFRYPYAARSVVDFWRRWHISLGAFFRDYVYIPLGGSRRSMVRTVLNMLIVWTLTGLWHGASWSFLLWGLYFFCFLVMEKLFLAKWLRGMPAFLGRVYLLTVVLFGWIIFRFRELPVIRAVMASMLCLNGNPLFSFEAGTAWKNNLFLLPVCVLAVTPLPGIALTRLRRIDNRAVAFCCRWAQATAPVILTVLSALALVGNQFNPFVYFQF